jgi:hypothetical protein
MLRIKNKNKKNVKKLKPQKTNRLKKLIPKGLQLDPLRRDSILLSGIVHLTFILFLIVNPYLNLLIKTDVKLNQEKTIVIDLQDIEITDETILPEAPNLLREEEEYYTPEFNEDQVSTKQEEDTDKEETTDSLIGEGGTVIPQKSLKSKKSNLDSERLGSIDDLLSSVEGIKRTMDNQKKLDIPKEMENENPDKEVTQEDLKHKAYQRNSVIKKFQGSLSISRLDALRIKLRNCWNVDPGAKGIQDMIIVIRATLSPDGNVNQVIIEDQSRYDNDSAFRAVADSARRAVVRCAPFDLPISKYQDWKDAVFIFNPANKSVK